MSYNQKEELLFLINAAFENVELDGGVSYLHAESLDMFEDDYDKSISNPLNEKRNWKSLINYHDFKKGDGVFSFYDSIGLRFYLPVYLTIAVLNPKEETVDSLLYTLTNKDDKRFEILNKQQCKCIHRVLQFIRFNSGYEHEFSWGDIDNSLSVWKNKITGQ
tara:strand:- start:174 stop:659 length:486 start_codon:yes stop_codon:yes gene_type:complete